MDAKTCGIMLLSSTSVNMQTTGSKITLFTVPTGYNMTPFGILARQPSATLAGAVDIDFGGDGSAGDWLQQITLAGLTGTTHQAWILQPGQAAGPPIVPVQKIIYAAATVFGTYINTGSTGAATCNFDLFGFLH